MYHEKLKEFFKSKGLKQKEVAIKLGCSENQISKYLRGVDRMSSTVIGNLKKSFPDINLEDIFSDTENEPLVLSESNMEPYMNIDFELGQIQIRIGQIREQLARKSHE